MENQTIETTEVTEVTEVTPENTTTQGDEMNMETRTTIEQVERPATTNESLEVTGAVMVVSKKPNVAALAGAAAGGAAIGAGAVIASTLASRKLTRELATYLKAYVNNDEASLKKIIENNPELGTLEHITLYDFMTEMDKATEKAKIGWKNPFGVTKKQISELNDLIALAFAAKKKDLNQQPSASNVETVEKAVEEIEVKKDNEDKKDGDNA